MKRHAFVKHNLTCDVELYDLLVTSTALLLITQLFATKFVNIFVITLLKINFMIFYDYLNYLISKRPAYYSQPALNL
jgi:hypothetical protein